MTCPVRWCIRAATARAQVSGAIPHHRLPLECHRFQPLREAYDVHWLREGSRCETAIPGRSGGHVGDAPALEAGDAVDADVIPAATAPAQRNEDHSLCAKVYRWEQGPWPEARLKPRRRNGPRT